MSDQAATRRFNRLCLTTLIAVYFLVLVGGVVRSTGSGMGCPDWPTCFGRLVPPTSVDQLPDNYKEQYAAYRAKKNQKFARYLSLLGLSATAEKITNDDSILQEADFNVAKTWVEYVNRLVGVVIGLLIIALFYSSWKIRQTHRALYLGAGAALFLVIVQGWFGSIVVSTNLTAWTVTVHMFLALVIVALLVWLHVRSGSVTTSGTVNSRILLITTMTALLIQVFFGTQVREVLDRLATSLPRSEWIANAGFDFIIHRSFSWVVLVLQVVLWLNERKTSGQKALTLVPFILILLSLLTGAGMAYLSVPAWLQPVHLLLAVVTFGWYFRAYVASRSNVAAAPKTT